MARDIEEFLKMAAKRRQQQKQQGGTPAARNRPATPQTPPPKPPQKPRRSLSADDDEIMVIGGPQRPTLGKGESVADHVRLHIDTSSTTENASHLGEEVGLADDKLEARLHSVFDHKVGHLAFEGQESGTTRVATSQLAHDLLDMLNSPKNIRQAILISEVLKRPDLDNFFN